MSCGHKGVSGHSVVHIYTPDLVRGNRVKAFWSRADAQPLPITVNVFRRYNGRRLYLELDGCPLCGVGVRAWPRNWNCQCIAGLGLLPWLNGEGCVGVWWVDGDVPYLVREVMRMPSVPNLDYRDLMQQGRTDWHQLVGVEDRKPLLPLVCDMLDRLDDVGGDLVELFDNAIGYSVEGYVLFREVSGRKIICFMTGGVGSDAAKEVEPELGHGAALGSAMLQFFYTWLGHQRGDSLALGALVRFFCLVVKPDSQAFLEYLHGGHRKHRGLKTLEQKCLEVVDPASLVNREVIHDLCSIRDVHAHVGHTTVSMLQSLLARVIAHETHASKIVLMK